MITHRMAVGTACATYVLLLAGGLVHSTGSSLACPDWPLCYGMFFPPMVGNIRFEHGHRLIAGTVGILTAVTAVLIWRKERRGLRLLAGGAVAAVFLQIILGGLTVIFLLPDLVSTAHLAVGTAFFSLLVVICIQTSPGAEHNFTEVDNRTRVVILAGTAVTYLQMILGGLVRHTESGLVCPNIPDCRGAWLPPITTPTGLHMLHRYGAVAALAAAVWCYFSARESRQLRIWAAGAVGLAVVQMILGVLSVTTQLSLWTVMSHLGVAVALLSCWVVLATLTWPATRPARSDARMAEA